MDLWSVLKPADFNREVHLGGRYDASELKKLAAEKKRKRCARCTPCLRSCRHSHLCPLPLCAQVISCPTPRRHIWYFGYGADIGAVWVSSHSSRRERAGGRS